MSIKIIGFIALAIVFIVAAFLVFYPVNKYLPEEETRGAKTLGGAMHSAAVGEYTAVTNRAELVEVLITLGELQHILNTLYQYDGEYPESLEDEGFSFNSASGIDNTSMQDGTLTVSLTEKYGNAKYIRMDPQFDSAQEPSGWKMTSNIESNALEGTGIESVLE